jgi:hypothetical protein
MPIPLMHVSLVPMWRHSMFLPSPFFPNAMQVSTKSWQVCFLSLDEATQPL